MAAVAVAHKCLCAAISLFFIILLSACFIALIALYASDVNSSGLTTKVGTHLIRTLLTHPFIYTENTASLQCNIPGIDCVLDQRIPPVVHWQQQYFESTGRRIQCINLRIRMSRCNRRRLVHSTSSRITSIH
jgi:hypothetical protein